MASALCTVAVCITGLVFLPGQSLVTTLTTDAVGRAGVVALPVIVVSHLIEVAKAAYSTVADARSRRRE